MCLKMSLNHIFLTLYIN